MLNVELVPACVVSLLHKVATFFTNRTLKAQLLKSHRQPLIVSLACTGPRFCGPLKVFGVCFTLEIKPGGSSLLGAGNLFSDGRWT